MSIRISHLDHLVLRVTDLGRVLRFYVEVLGCQVCDPEGNTVELRGPPATPSTSARSTA